MALPTMEKQPVKAKKPTNVWLIVSIILAVVLVGVLAVTFVKLSGGEKMTVISADKASSSLISFINEVYAARIGQATFKSVSETSGLYKIELTITPPDQNGQPGAPVDQTVYATRDGKLFVPEAINIADLSAQYQAYKEQQAAGTIQNQPAVTAEVNAPSADTTGTAGTDEEVVPGSDSATQ